LKISQLDHENSAWKSFLTLQGVVKKKLNEILLNILNKSIQEIQNSNGSNDLKWKEELSVELKHYDNELKTFKICLQYYHLDQNLELEVIREGLKLRLYFMILF
jgi:hypothetical protein